MSSLLLCSARLETVDHLLVNVGWFSLEYWISRTPKSVLVSNEDISISFEYFVLENIVTQQRVEHSEYDVWKKET